MPPAPDLVEVLSRLDRIESLLSRLATVPHSSSVAAVPAGAKRLKVSEVLAILRVSRTTLRGYEARGLLTALRPAGKKGPNQRVYYLPDEVAALAVSEDAARELQARKKKQR